MNYEDRQANKCHISVHKRGASHFFRLDTLDACTQKLHVYVCVCLLAKTYSHAHTETRKRAGQYDIRTILLLNTSPTVAAFTVEHHFSIFRSSIPLLVLPLLIRLVLS